MTATMELDWSEIFLSYQKKIWTYIYKRTSDPALAEDLASETFIKAMEYDKKGKGAREHFSGWLYRIAHNLVIDHYRDRERAFFMGLDDVPNLQATVGNTEDCLDAIEVNEILVNVLPHLTESQYQAVYLRYGEELQFHEVGLRMNRKPGAAKALIHAGLKTAKLVYFHGSKGPKKYEHCFDIIYQTVLDHGPLTMREIADRTEKRIPQVSAVLIDYNLVFKRVDFYMLKTKKINIWGLVGIHDREAA